MTAPSLHTADVPSQSQSQSQSLSPELREDLRSYADLGGFTLTAETHAWYAAVDTVDTPEEARAASTVLAELRGRDLPAVRDAATWLVGTPSTVGETGRAVALLLRVSDTLAVLSPQAYEAEDLDELVAATASGKWRKQRDVKVAWRQRRSLRQRARALAASGRPRAGTLHAALASATEERTQWAALATADAAVPALPDDAELLAGAARAIEAAGAGLTTLGRLLQPERDLADLPFGELTDLLDRLAADEGTLYRLPALRSLRDRLREAGLDDLLAELTARGGEGADGAFGAGNAGDAGDAGAGAVATAPGPRAATSAHEAVTEPVAEAEAEVEPVPVAEVEPEPVETEAPAPADTDPEAVTEPVADAEPVAAEAAVSAPDPDPEPVAEVEPEPAEPVAVAEVAAEPEPEPVTEGAVAAPEAVREPVADAEPEAAEAAVSAPAPAPAPEPEPVSVPEVQPDPVIAETPAPAKAQPAVAKSPGDGDGPKARRPRRPAVTAGRPVTAYSAAELTALVRWIDSDGEKRTDDELLRAAMKELGFARLGPRIKEALGAAVSEARG